MEVPSDAALWTWSARAGALSVLKPQKSGRRVGRSVKGGGTHHGPINFPPRGLRSQNQPHALQVEKVIVARP